MSGDDTNNLNHNKMLESPYTGPIEPGILPVCEALNGIPGILTSTAEVGCLKQK